MPLGCCVIIKKPWPNELVSRHNMHENLDVLATPFSQALRKLAYTFYASTLVEIKACTHLDQSKFSTFLPPNQVNGSCLATY